MKDITYFAFVVLILFSSCVGKGRLATVQCKFDEDKELVVKITLPKYKRQQNIKAGGEPGIEYMFWYKDSSAVYLPSFRGGAMLNYDSIRAHPTAYSDRFFADSVELSGVDSSGLCWRETKRKPLYFGYYKARADKKPSFDKAIESVEIR